MSQRPVTESAPGGCDLCAQASHGWARWDDRCRPKTGAGLLAVGRWSNQAAPPIECFRDGRFAGCLTPYGFLRQSLGQRVGFVAHRSAKPPRRAVSRGGPFGTKWRKPPGVVNPAAWVSELLKRWATHSPERANRATRRQSAASPRRSLHAAIVRPQVATMTAHDRQSLREEAVPGFNHRQRWIRL